MHKLNINTWSESDLKGIVTNLRQALKDRDMPLGLNQSRDLIAKTLGAHNWKSLEAAVGKGTIQPETNTTDSSTTVWVATHTSYADHGEPFVSQWTSTTEVGVMREFFDAVMVDHIAWEAFAQNVSDTMDRHGLEEGYITTNNPLYDPEELILDALVFTDMSKVSEETRQIIRHEQESIRLTVRNLLRSVSQDTRMDWEFITEKLWDHISLRYWIALYRETWGYDEELVIESITAKDGNKATQETLYTLTHLF